MSCQFQIIFGTVQSLQLRYFIVIFVMTISGGLWYVLCILSGMILIREIFQMAASLKRYFFRYFDKDISKIAYIIQNKLVELNLQNWVKNTKIFQTN